MKRFVTILALALFVMAPAAMAQTQQYGWTLSGSATDPDVNTGAVNPAPYSIYLHLVCAVPDGAAAAEFDLQLPVGYLNFGFTTANGFLNAGGGSNLLLATPCTNGPVNAGSWTIFGSTPGDCCLVASAANGKNVSVDCTVFAEWQNDTNGYGIGQPAACRVGLLCQTVSVEDSSWGTIKGLYR